MLVLQVVETGVQVGANVTLSAFIARLEILRPSRPGFAYFDQLGQHLKLVGSVLVRNVSLDVPCLCPL